VRAKWTAFPGPGDPAPHPSRIISITGLDLSIGVLILFSVSNGFQIEQLQYSVAAAAIKRL
jgi:hypothetical protein